MDRNFGLERVYNLGDYKSIRVSDYANGIPEELALDEKFMSLLRYLQLVEIEKAYYSYSLLSQDMRNTFSTDGERFEELVKVSTDVYSKLLELYSQTKKEN